MKFIFTLFLFVMSFNLFAQEVSYQDTVKFLMNQTEQLSLDTKCKATGENGPIEICKSYFESISEDGDVVFVSLTIENNAVRVMRRYEFNLGELKAGSWYLNISRDTPNKVSLSSRERKLFIEYFSRFDLNIRNSQSLTEFIFFRFPTNENALRFFRAFENLVNTAPESPF